jgi:hypothetical protein
LIIPFLNSCVEEGSFSEYEIQNGTGYNVKIINLNGGDEVFRNCDTVIINKDSSLVFNYYEDSNGGSNIIPFPGVDSLLFIINDTLKKSYTWFTDGKNPLNLESYEGGKTKYKNHITYYEYQYQILIEDFASN